MAMGHEVEATPLQTRIHELESKLRTRDDQLSAERDRSSKARKKIRQLLAKIQERDRLIGMLKGALEQALECSSDCKGSIAAAVEAGSPTKPDGSTNANSSVDSVRHPADAPRVPVCVVDERAAIVAQLEEHLTQMRASLASRLSELHELEKRRQIKEAEWNSLNEAQPVADMHMYWQTLGMIGQQILEKRRFADELSHKTRALEVQLTQYRPSTQASVGEDVVDSDEVDAADQAADWTQQFWTKEASSHPPASSSIEDEQLSTFLSAAGQAATVVLGRPALREAFASSPPRLSAAALDGCGPVERAHALSLFVAWVAVAGEPVQALIVSDMSFKRSDVQEIRGTLETCGAQLEEIEMTRCPSQEAICRPLLHTIATQPLRRLNLGYNALGVAGAATLMEVAPAWSNSLEHLCLEMNGLGDAGCLEIANSLSKGLLGSLRALELGWNELSATCAPALAALLDGPANDSCICCRLMRLGLGGNRLGSEGAQALILGALGDPTRRLDLDMSMNHVGSEPLYAVAKWALSCSCNSTLVSISLEWNTIDDVEAVNNAAHALATSPLGASFRSPTEPGSELSPPLLLVGNNDELADLDPAEVFRKSCGLIRS